MKQELQIFFTALMFYTRIPVPKWVEYSQAYLDRASRYFPLMGWIVGGAMALTIWLSQWVFPLSVSVVLALIVSVLMTGAFHEDGFADSCDGFGGGWNQKQILEIMKDSRSGVYGVLGSVLLLLLKFTLLVAIVPGGLRFWGPVLILAHTLSRLAAVAISFTASYVRADELSKAKPIAKKLSLPNLLFAAVWVVPPFLLLGNPRWILVLLPVLGATVYLRRYFVKWIGGYTGDCLGAAQQVNEVLILLSCLGLWKFI